MTQWFSGWTPALQGKVREDIKDDADDDDESYFLRRGLKNVVQTSLKLTILRLSLQSAGVEPFPCLRMTAVQSLGTRCVSISLGLGKYRSVFWELALSFSVGASAT